jgi:glycosyltransferase involved in cell wall biosynthesis
MAELQSLAQAIYPLAEFSGARHGAELEACFRQADVFVLPGTGGLAVQQAMAYGLPVIVAEADGTQGELVRPENGWLLTADDQAALVHALEEALADIPRLRRMGSASYRIVMEEVNLESMVAVFVRAMLSVA